MMISVDTSSWFSLIRYYLPFDDKSILFNHLKSKVENKEIIILDKVYEECNYKSQGVIISSFPFLEKNHIDTTTILPTPRMLVDIDNRWVRKSMINDLTPDQYEIIKQDFLNKADAKQIIWASLNKNLVVTPCIITEESRIENDTKHFKKIPAICDLLDLRTMRISEYLQEQSDIRLYFDKVNPPSAPISPEQPS